MICTGEQRFRRSGGISAGGGVVRVGLGTEGPGFESRQPDSCFRRSEGTSARLLNYDGEADAVSVSLVGQWTAERAGLDPDRYSGHSLRAGFPATAAVSCRCGSAAVRYVFPASIFVIWAMSK